jgi:hypothetical protein
MIVLTLQGRPLRTAAAPSGIGSFEFAWSQGRAEQILDSWANLVGTARCQLLIDFGFLILYPLAISLGCGMLAESPHNSFGAPGLFVSWAVLAAGPLDAAENFALLHMLGSGASEAAARVAGWCAGLKFVLVYAGLGYFVLQGLAVLLRKVSAA